VIETNKLMTELSTDDSIIVQDFYSLGFLKGDILKAAKKQMDLIAKNGEPWKFGLEMKENPKESVTNFLSKCNQEITDYYLFGEKLDIDPFYCIVESKRLNK
jgi:hypothetical protein